MKRGAIGLAGFSFGVFWTWFCLYVLGHVTWTGSVKARHSCIDAGDCSWAGIVMALSYVLIPPIIFGVVSGAAWQRWTVREWARRFIGLGFLTAAFYTSVAIMTRDV